MRRRRGFPCRFGSAAAVSASVAVATLPDYAWAAAASTVPLLGQRATAGSLLSPAWLLVVAFASLLPFLLLMMTSFVKIAVVLSILKSALGGAQIPPSSIITGLAILLSAYVMAPTGQKMYEALQAPTSVHATPAPAKGMSGEWLHESGVGAALDVVDRVKEPLRDFLLKNADPRERASFAALSGRNRGVAADAAVSERDFLVLAPAFVSSELRRAFEIGFLLFLPFLILDLVIASLLAALGMQSLSPTAISLPFKLLLFVLIDGWHLVARGLVQSYS